MKVKLNKENFPEWYNEIVELSGLVDKRYPIKGMNVWLPYGWELMRNIDRVIREEMKRTSHQEVCFPLLIPKGEFQKEADHIKGFSEEVYWVTHGGSTPLDVPLLLRPTSETAMYPMFSLWVRSHSDLPLKIFQIVNVFRYETKQTRPFIRMREIHFFEAHTCHRDFEDAERQIKEDLEIMENVSKKLCIPYLELLRPEWDKFAGAYYTVGIDTLMPSGRTLQIASIHQYRDNFARAYNITYEDDDGEHRFVHQTTYGMSERLVGAIVGLHGDNRGIVLPPEIAPIQVVIVPIPKKGFRERVEEEARKVKNDLEEGGLRVVVDLRDIRP
ncbi:MAG: proline--tRNA ligase, partial [Thermoplasmata archaeon]|nr:proline--tRNA ligase [Thermoplasmata archaeon]